MSASTSHRGLTLASAPWLIAICVSFFGPTFHSCSTFDVPAQELLGRGIEPVGYLFATPYLSAAILAVVILLVAFRSERLRAGGLAALASVLLAALSPGVILVLSFGAPDFEEVLLLTSPMIPAAALWILSVRARSFERIALSLAAYAALTLPLAIIAADGLDSRGASAPWLLVSPLSDAWGAWLLVTSVTVLCLLGAVSALWSLRRPAGDSRA